MPAWLANLLGGGLIDKILSFIPNPEEKAKAQMQMQAALMQAGIDADKEQREINKTEAASSSIFVAGWRPAVGWLCVAGLAWQFFLCPMLTWVLTASGAHTPPFPMIGDSTLTDLLYALLGIGSLRTIDKATGNATANIFKKK